MIESVFSVKSVSNDLSDSDYGLCSLASVVPTSGFKWRVSVYIIRDLI